MTSIQRKPVVMARELRASVYNEAEKKAASKSIAESMARLYPGYVYVRDEVIDAGKLVVIKYTYEYSRWKHMREQVSAYIRNLLKR